jgi:hypothetical protein
MMLIPVHCEKSASNDWSLNSIRWIPVVRRIEIVQSLFIRLLCKHISQTAKAYIRTVGFNDFYFFEKIKSLDPWMDAKLNYKTHL